MKLNFTKGPWTILPEEEDRDYIRIRGTQLGGRYKIANVHVMRFEGVHPNEIEESRAIARAIMMVPNLVADLQLAAETLRRYERLHREKNTVESNEKADVNRSLALRFEATLLNVYGLN